VPLRENNLIGAMHIRYGAYGGIAYHHIADSYIALFTTFISCGGCWRAMTPTCRWSAPSYTRRPEARRSATRSSWI